MTLALARPVIDDGSAHGLIKQAGDSYRDQLTREDRQIVTALLAARQADVAKLMALAA